MYSSFSDDKSNECSASKRRKRPAITTFRDWRKVPKDEWRTAKEWKQVSRKVEDGEKPTGRVIYTEVVTGLGLVAAKDPEIVLYEDDEHAEIIAKQWPLWHVSQTRPAKISPRTLAMQKYLRVFYRHARKDQYATRQLNPCTGKEGWITVTAYATGDRPWQREELLESHVIQHVNHTISRRRIRLQSAQRHTIAIKSGDMTRFVALDVDCHAKDDAEVFLRRVELLLDHFHGDGWHYQVRDGEITGIHFLKVFDKALPLKDAHQQVQAALAELDTQHPDLNFLKLEVYPTIDGNGIRLPLAKGYLMILDKIVEPVVHRGQEAGDVESYIAWLENPNRQYFAKNRLLSFLRINVVEKPAQAKPAPATPASGVAMPSDLGRLKGCCWQKITGYWLGEWNPPNCLDAVVAVTARMGFFFGHAEDRTTAMISRFVRELPAHVHHCSSRLIKQDWKEIERCIVKEVQKVYQENKAQPDVEQSTTKLQAAVAAWSKSGLDILDKATWGKAGLPKPTIIITEEDQHAINSWLAPVLGPLKYQSLACDVAAFMALLVNHKMTGPVAHARQRACSYDYWKKVLEGRFGLKLGNKNKIADILKAAQEVGIIKRWCGHSKAQKRGIIYEVGERMKKYMKNQGAEESTVYGSILFEYHLLEDMEKEAKMDADIRALLGDEAWAEAVADAP